MATLAGLTTRVQTALMDTGAAVWDSATITEGIRLAVGEYSLAGKAAVTVTGLDGAGSSNLPATHDSVIVWGAAAYAALSRTVDRADTKQLQGDGQALKAWGDQRLREFKGMLGFIFPEYLVALSGTAGTSSSGEDPAKVAAEVNLLAAQTTLVTQQAGAIGDDAAKIAAETSLLDAQSLKVAAETAKIQDTNKRAAEIALLTAQAAKVNAEAGAIGANGESAEKLAAEIALMQAQAALVQAQEDLAAAQAAAVAGQEGRAAAAATLAAADREAEAARLADLRNSTDSPWGNWSAEPLQF